ncbi:MAG TPA: sigma-54-dependent Fis family transcriptional regulator [Candidatus Marinimicrobia bacterium]|nr:sigma-54-dependent Fis family transcriptional regulator [Candidatus Neomarinimicrobiota bacterium]
MPRSYSILIVDDEISVRDSLYNWFTDDGYIVEVAEDAKTALNMLEENSYDIILADIRMPGMDGLEMQRQIRKMNDKAIVIIMTAFASVDSAVQALKDGAYDYITKPFDPDDLTHMIRNATKQLNLSEENESLREKVSKLENVDDIIGESPEMQSVLKDVEIVAKSDSTVIITGDSGTGKELIARAIHANSSRRYFPLVAVHCGALAESLLESELFGHAKGAFTGAQFQRKGKFEMADGGTIFLDEIATISAKMQIELLRVLETKSFVRVGGTKEIKSDFRVICATNRDLKQMVKEGSFREDLYYRLNVYNIHIPPLRERLSDVPLMAAYFLKKYAKAMNKTITKIDDSAIKILQEYEWPGNVRELENMIERAVLVSSEPAIRAKDLPIIKGSSAPLPGVEKLDDLEKSHILQVLEKYEWNISRSAAALGIDRVTLYNKIKKHKIQRPES